MIRAERPLNRMRAGVVATLACWFALTAALVQAADPAAPVATPPGPEQAAPAAGAPPPRLGRGILLIAKRGLDDPNFGHGVILITQYDDAGTVGLILNRTLPVPASEALPPIAQLGVDAGPLRFGGPVETASMQLLIRSGAGPDEALRVFGDVYRIDDRPTLDDLSQGRVQASSIRVYAGYTGWGPGQLETELLRGDWYLWPATEDDVFSMQPETLWPRLIQLAAAQWTAAPEPVPSLACARGDSIMLDSMPARLTGGRPARTRRAGSRRTGEQFKIQAR